MKWMRRMTLVIAMMTFAAYFGSERLRAMSCNSVSYFNYGWEAYGCGLWAGPNTGCVDLYNDCFAECYYSLGSHFGGAGLDWCYDYLIGDPSDGLYNADARCTCYVI